ncbi:unnamed protein product [marine sediment metagenome]|uniref:Uncharacterized protein n=1 Tax=marine sediment metagenome TaxID=412755 RepID=X0ZSM8_9ZZZZ
MDPGTLLALESLGVRVAAIEAHFWILQGELIAVLGGFVVFLAKPWAARIWNGRNGRDKK